MSPVVVLKKSDEYKIMATIGVAVSDTVTVARPGGCAVSEASKHNSKICPY